MAHMELNASFWAGKRVLVTGHTGFKGGWLCLWLQHWGAQVLGYALPPPTTPNFFTLTGLESLITSEIGDIRDQAQLTACFQRFQPEIVIHMAAQPLVYAAYRDPVETFSVYVQCTVLVLEAARQTASVRVVLNVTSDKCYLPSPSGQAHHEQDPLGGYEPYASSKACAEWVTEAYRRSYFAPAGIGLASGRAGNTFGGGDWAEARIIPDLVRSLARGEAAPIRNPQAVRPWQYVLEPLSGYLHLCRQLWQDPNLAQGWNFGPQEAQPPTVAELATQLCQLWGHGAQWVDVGSAQLPPETHLLRLDWQQAKTRLGWAPRLPIAQALAWTVTWYQAHLAGQDMQSLSRAQIDTYLHLEPPR